MSFWLTFHRIVCEKSAKNMNEENLILESQSKNLESGIQMPQSSRNTEWPNALVSLWMFVGSAHSH